MNRNYFTFLIADNCSSIIELYKCDIRFVFNHLDNKFKKFEKGFKKMNIKYKMNILFTLSDATRSNKASSI